MASYDGTNIEYNTIKNAHSHNIIENGEYYLILSGEDRSGDSVGIKIEAPGGFGVNLTGTVGATFTLQDDEKFHINCDTESTDCLTGALVVDGGVGIGGNLYQCGDIFSLGDGVLVGSDESVTITTEEVTITSTTVTIDADVTITGALEFGTDGSEGGLVVGGELTVDGCVTIEYDHCLRFKTQEGVDFEDWEISREAHDSSYITDEYDLMFKRPYQSAEMFFRETVVYEMCVGPNDICGSHSSAQNTSSGEDGSSNHRPGWSSSGDLIWTGKSGESYTERVWIPIPWSVPDGFFLTDVWYTHHTESGDADYVSTYVTLQRHTYTSSNWETCLTTPTMTENDGGTRTNHHGWHESEFMFYPLTRHSHLWRIQISMNGDHRTQNWKNKFYGLKMRWEGRRMLPLKSIDENPSHEDDFT